MKSLNSIYLFALVIFLIKYSEAKSSSKFWVTSCKPCVDVLKVCDYCTTNRECLDCVYETSNTQCYNCLNEIFSTGNAFYCDNEFEYHNIACKYFCKTKNSSDGLCDYDSGECLCSGTPEITTAESILLTTAEFVTQEPITQEPITQEIATSEEPATTAENLITQEITTSEEPTTTTTKRTTRPTTTISPFASCMDSIEELKKCKDCAKDDCYEW